VPSPSRTQKLQSSGRTIGCINERRLVRYKPDRTCLPRDGAATAPSRRDDTKSKMKAADPNDTLESIQVNEEGISQLQLEIKQLQDKKIATDSEMKAR
jgi:hypothetical protein